MIQKLLSEITTIYMAPSLATEVIYQNIAWEHDFIDKKRCGMI